MNKYLKYSFYVVVTVLIAFVFVQAARQQGEPTGAKKAENPDPRRSTNTKATAAKSEPDSPYIDGVARMREYQFDYGYTPRGNTAYHAFYLHNVGTDTLHITRIRPG